MSTDRALARMKRIAQFSESVSFRADTPGNEAAVAAFERLRKDPAHAKAITSRRRLAIAIAEAYRLNGPGLYIDHYLRQFLTEFNGRILKGEGAKMPSSFSVMRSFVDPDDVALVLKLLPERTYSVTINRLLDHITDPSINGALKLLIDDLEELTIYEINMLGGFSEFSLPGHDNYIYCGCAFVREGAELSIVGLFGRHNPEPTVSKVNTAGTAVPGKEFLLDGREDIDMSDHALFGEPHIQPIILLMRVDLQKSTTQARYVLEEQVDSYNVGSDDPDIIEFLRDAPDADTRITKTLELVSRHGELFAILAQMPTFCGRAIERHEDDFVVERIPTRIRLAREKPSVRRMLALVKPRDKPAFVEVQTLHELTSDGASYEMSTAGLVVETSGYWKTLPLSETGRDKSGRPVQGKTWVNSQSSWFQSKVAALSDDPATLDLTVGVSANERSGELYVMRSAFHPRNVYKVGFTTKSAEERARQLAATSGQPDMFNVVQSWCVKNPREIEHQVHRKLDEFRLNKSREFFSIEYSRLRSSIENVISQNNALIAD